MLTAIRRDSLARNSVLIMASTVVTSGLGYLFWLVAARSLDRSAIGAATALIAAATVASMVANLGIGHMFIQRLPGSTPAGWSRIVTAGLLLATMATAAAAGLAALALPRMSANFAALTAWPAAFGLVATAVAVTASALLDQVFVAHRAGHGMLLRNLALGAGKLLTLVAVTASGLSDARAVLLAWTVPSLVVTAYTMGWGLPGSGRLTLRGLGAELRPIRAALTGHHLINLGQAGPTALLPVLVTARLGTADNAHFYVAWMTASVLFMVSPAVASALYAERTNAAPVSLPRAALVVLAVTAGPGLVLFLAGGWILGLVSPGYAAAGGPLLKILVLAAIPDAITNLAVAHWRSLGLLRRCLRLNLLMAVVCVVLAWILLPAGGIVAAGWAWLAGQTVGAIAVAIRARRRPPVARPHPPGRASPRFHSRTVRPAIHSRPRSRSRSVR